MTRPFDDPSCPSHCPGADPFERRTAINQNFLDDQIVDINLLVLGGIGYGRFNDLAKDPSPFFRHESEGGDCFIDFHPSHHICDQSGLLRRDSNIFPYGSSFHSVYP